MEPEKLEINTYNYDLPENRIPAYPLPDRNRSKLLVYNNNEISQLIFSELDQQLRANDILVMNDTKVIPARLFLKKKTGGVIEVLCLEPIGKSHQDAMLDASNSKWKCMVGGAKKWKSNEPIELHFGADETKMTLRANKISQKSDHFEIEFSWSPESLTFSSVLDMAGEIPLPPYFDRKVEVTDLVRYQTVFAMHQGSVAAPTAALHFTTDLLNVLKEKDVQIENLTLHVGAGTFKPVSSITLSGHEMHGEFFSVSSNLIEKIIQSRGNRIVAVGTTSMRTLESLYWLGKKMRDGYFEKGKLPDLKQWEPYQLKDDISIEDALNAILDFCRENGTSRFEASTSILIAPGFQFRICQGLITNFHMPKSTLLVLISAFVGDQWRKIYDYALENEFRFLSYGDSSILWR